MDCDVLILGAGAAGLAAGREVRRAGRTPLILEARGRIGGRLHTSSLGDLPADLGAAFIHGASEGNPLLGLARSTNATLLDPIGEHSPFLIDADGTPHDRRTLDGLDQVLPFLAEAIERKSSRARASDSLESGMESALARLGNVGEPFRRAVAHALSAEFELIRGEDASRLGLRHAFADDVIDGPDLMIGEGFRHLAEALAVGLAIHFNTPIRRVRATGAGVTVETPSRVYTAPAAIVTLPLGVLRGGDVVFDPPLPAAKQRAIRGLGIGAVNKVIMQFSERFWPQSATIFARTTGDRSRTSDFYALHRSHGAPVLVWFVKGDYSRELERGSDEDFIGAAVAELRAMFQSVPDPVAALVSRWTSDPFARGSHTIMAPGSNPRMLSDLAAPVGRTLFFAGEATSREYPGTVHGAVLSGQRAASEWQASAG